MNYRQEFTKLLRSWLRSLLLDLIGPPPIYICYKESNLATVFDVVASFATPKETLSVREVTLSIDGSVEVVKLAGDAMQYNFSAPLNAEVSLSLVDVDLSGNRQTEPSVATTTIVDKFAPEPAGPISFAIVGQREI